MRRPTTNHQNPNTPTAAAADPLKTLQPEAMLEELSMLRLEGRYFCFDPKEAAKRQGVLIYTDGNRELIIEVSPRFGHPSLLAYKVLQAIFKKITDLGKPYTDAITLSQRELGRLVGRESFGGRDAQQLYTAISQLRSTNVELQVLEKSPNDSSANTSSHSVMKTWNFSVLSNLGFIGEGQRGLPSKIHTAVLRLDPLIAHNLQAGHFAVFNWERMAQLEPLTAALYKRLYLHFSNLYQNQYQRHNLKFEKDYADLCAQWLGGLKPKIYKSQVLQQLREHIKALRNVGLVGHVTIERRSNGLGFKLVFRPGEGFFEDYETYYVKAQRKKTISTDADFAFDESVPAAAEPSLPAVGTALPPKLLRKVTLESSSESPLQNNTEVHAAMNTVTYFYDKLHRDLYGAKSAHPSSANGVYSDKDLAYARELLAHFTPQAAHALMDFTIAEAHKTHFKIRNIKACSLFMAQWQQERTKQEAKAAHDARAAQQNLSRLRAEHERAVQSAYQAHCEQLVQAYVQGLSLVERAAIKQAASDKVLAKNLTTPLPTDAPYLSESTQGIMHRMRVDAEFKQLVSSRLTLPSLKEWLAQSPVGDRQVANPDASLI